jgi:hypothetical protein
VFVVVIAETQHERSLEPILFATLQGRQAQVTLRH